MEKRGGRRRGSRAQCCGGASRRRQYEAIEERRAAARPAARWARVRARKREAYSTLKRGEGLARDGYFLSLLGFIKRFIEFLIEFKVWCTSFTLALYLHPLFSAAHPARRAFKTAAQNLSKSGNTRGRRRAGRPAITSHSVSTVRRAPTGCPHLYPLSMIGPGTLSSCNKYTVKCAVTA